MTETIYKARKVPLPTSYVVVDVETNRFISFYPHRIDMIQIAAAKYRDGELVAEFNSLVRPFHSISEDVLNLTGISLEELETAPLIHDVFPQFVEFIEDLPIMGFNVARMEMFYLNLFHYILNNQICFPDANRLYFDVKSLGSHVTKKEDRPVVEKIYGDGTLRYFDSSLEVYANMFGIDYTNAHNAIHDVRITKRVYDALVAYAEEKDGKIPKFPCGFYDLSDARLNYFEDRLTKDNYYNNKLEFRRGKKDKAVVSKQIMTYEEFLKVKEDLEIRELQAKEIAVQFKADKLK